MGRWTKDNTAILTPDEFISAAERGRLRAAAAITLNSESRYRVESTYGKEFCMNRWPEAYGKPNLGGLMNTIRHAVHAAKSLIPIVLVLVLISGLAYSQTTSPGTFRAPTVRTGTTTTSIYWNAGTVNNGGHAVVVAAGNAALGATKTDCTPPAYSACDILYVNSSGTGAVTTDIFTAQGAGNTILAFIETTAGSVPSNIVLPTQSSSVWNASAAGNYSQTLTANPTNPSSQRLIRAEYTLPAALTSGTLTAIRGAITAPTAGTVAGSYLFGVQGKITTGTATISGTSSAAVYAQYDVTGGTISAGNHAAIQANFVGVAAPTTFPMDGIYIEQAGGGRINSYLRGLGNVSYIFDLAGSAFADSLTGAGSSCTTAGWLKINVEGTTRYINLCSAN